MDTILIPRFPGCCGECKDSYWESDDDGRVCFKVAAVVVDSHLYCWGHIPDGQQHAEAIFRERDEWDGPSVPRCHACGGILDLLEPSESFWELCARQLADAMLGKPTVMSIEDLALLAASGWGGLDDCALMLVLREVLEPRASELLALPEGAKASCEDIRVGCRWDGSPLPSEREG